MGGIYIYTHSSSSIQKPTTYKTSGIKRQVPHAAQEVDPLCNRRVHTAQNVSRQSAKEY
jgi:hypothetical protein